MSAATFAAAFAALYAGHMVGDHLVQTHKMSQGKTAPTGWLLPMAGHLAGYGLTQLAALICLAVVDVRLSLLGVVVGLAFSVGTHGFIDRRWPVRWLLEHTGSKEFADLNTGGINGMYLGDQAAHIGCLFVAALLIGGLS